MTISTDINTPERAQRNRRRAMIWVGGIAALLSIPAIAMQFTGEVQWTLSDFIFMGGLLSLIAFLFELAARATINNSYRIATGLALLASFLLVWINGAVGIIGNENNPLNEMFFGVIAVALIGAILARFKPKGMARAMLAAGIAQIIVTAVALYYGYIILPISALFFAIWLLSSRLYDKAGQDQASTVGI